MTAPPAPSTHHLLLALAGRVDDDLLATARELVAIGEEPQALEILVATLVADRTALPAPLRSEVVELSRRRAVEFDVDNLLAPAAGSLDGTRHVFGAGPAGADERLAELITSPPPGSTVRVTWRLTPAGAAPGPVPHPVVLVELSGPGIAPEVVSYRLGAHLTRSGLPASVEAYTPADALPAYQRAALERAREIERVGGPAPFGGAAAQGGVGHGAAAHGAAVGGAGRSGAAVHRGPVPFGESAARHGGGAVHGVAAAPGGAAVPTETTAHSGAAAHGGAAAPEAAAPGVTTTHGEAATRGGAAAHGDAAAEFAASDEVPNAGPVTGEEAASRPDEARPTPGPAAPGSRPSPSPRPVSAGPGTLPPVPRPVLGQPMTTSQPPAAFQPLRPRPEAAEGAVADGQAQVPDTPADRPGSRPVPSPGPRPHGPRPGAVEPDGPHHEPRTTPFERTRAPGSRRSGPTLSVVPPAPGHEPPSGPRQAPVTRPTPVVRAEESLPTPVEPWPASSGEETEEADPPVLASMRDPLSGPLREPLLDAQLDRAETGPVPIVGLTPPQVSPVEEGTADAEPDAAEPSDAPASAPTTGRRRRAEEPRREPAAEWTRDWTSGAWAMPTTERRPASDLPAAGRAAAGDDAGRTAPPGATSHGSAQEDTTDPTGPAQGPSDVDLPGSRDGANALASAASSTDRHDHTVDAPEFGEHSPLSGSRRSGDGAAGTVGSQGEHRTSDATARPDGTRLDARDTDSPSGGSANGGGRRRADAPDRTGTPFGAPTGYGGRRRAERTNSAADSSDGGEHDSPLRIDPLDPLGAASSVFGRDDRSETDPSPVGRDAADHSGAPSETGDSRGSAERVEEALRPADASSPREATSDSSASDGLSGSLLEGDAPGTHPDGDASGLRATGVVGSPLAGETPDLGRGGNTPGSRPAGAFGMALAGETPGPSRGGNTSSPSETSDPHPGSATGPNRGGNTSASKPSDTSGPHLGSQTGPNRSGDTSGARPTGISDSPRNGEVRGPNRGGDAFGARPTGALDSPLAAETSDRERGGDTFGSQPTGIAGSALSSENPGPDRGGDTSGARPAGIFDSLREGSSADRHIAGSHTDPAPGPGGAPTASHSSNTVAPRSTDATGPGDPSDSQLGGATSGSRAGAPAAGLSGGASGPRPDARDFHSGDTLGSAAPGSSGDSAGSPQSDNAPDLAPANRSGPAAAAHGDTPDEAEDDAPTGRRAARDGVPTIRPVPGGRRRARHRPDDAEPDPWGFATDAGPAAPAADAEPAPQPDEGPQDRSDGLPPPRPVPRTIPRIRRTSEQPVSGLFGPGEVPPSRPDDPFGTGPGPARAGDEPHGDDTPTSDEPAGQETASESYSSLSSREQDLLRLLQQELAVRESSPERRNGSGPYGPPDLVG
ncbi:hypothetical protein ACQP04_36030 [Pseudonocardia halophobica]|uniref:hypothetical protein n=1 Tax=Pseudonocardia halophobica TaxID=29401 RepID=UPI003D94B7D7